LLKILSRITEPTTGKVSINGRVSSLLEVGTGFHPELTGRENVFLNGAILGMKRKEIQSKFDEILDFSGVEKFLDTPLKHYSSGMQLRLAFAVAAFLEPEILIIDEVLSVGDAEFQRKCLGKMEDVSKSGRTILFVSHDLTAVNNLTQKCILIKSGKLVDFNSTAKTINKYIWESTQYTQFEKKVNNANIKPQILKCVVKTSLANNVHEQSKEISFIIDYYITEIPKNNTWLSLHITDLYDRGVIHLMTNTKLSGLADKPGLNRLTCLIPQLRLYMGKYNVSLYFSGPPNAEVYERLKDILSFEVIMDNISNEFGWKTNTCTYIEQCKWTNSNV
jgi:lipopolysaccharide transport system ATP-binding protein